MSSFAERFAKPVDAKEAAQTLLNLLDDPDNKRAIGQGADVIKIKGTLEGIIAGNIMMGDTHLAEPIKESLQRVLSYRRAAYHAETLDKHTPPAREAKQTSKNRIVPDDGTVPYYDVKYEFLSLQRSKDGFGHDAKPDSGSVEKLLDDVGIASLKDKAEKFSAAVEQVYAAGICVANNPLASKARGQSPAG
ncbi:MAG: hypothetical protein ACOYNL_03000 [Rickettsiales bacterium]